MGHVLVTSLMLLPALAAVTWAGRYWPDNLRSLQLREYLNKHPLTRAQLLSHPYLKQRTPDYLDTIFPIHTKFPNLRSNERDIDISAKKSTQFPSTKFILEQKKSSQDDPNNFQHDTLPPSSNPILVAENKKYNDVYFVAIVSGCSAVAIFGIIGAGLWICKIQHSKKAAADVDYPAYGVTGPNKDSSSPNGDRKLAQSAQMYHYQHQKQQMIAVEKASSARQTSASDGDSEEENEEGDYTVYECPGLASTVEMEVKNPLFQDDNTPVSPPVVATEK